MAEDLIIFLFGCLVTALCIAAVAILLWGATHGGEANESAPGGRE